MQSKAQSFQEEAEEAIFVEDMLEEGDDGEEEDMDKSSFEVSMGLAQLQIPNAPKSYMTGLVVSTYSDAVFGVDDCWTGFELFRQCRFGGGTIIRSMP